MDIIKIDKLIPTDDYKVYVIYENGKKYLYDANRLVEKFKILQDIDFFKGRCTVINDTLAWDIDGDMNEENCIDIAPESIFDSEEVTDEELDYYLRNNGEYSNF